MACSTRTSSESSAASTAFPTVASTLGLLWVEVRKMEAALLRLADADALTDATTPLVQD